jgi:hypothetical protein
MSVLAKTMRMSVNNQKPQEFPAYSLRRITKDHSLNGATNSFFRKKRNDTGT